MTWTDTSILFVDGDITWADWIPRIWTLIDDAVAASWTLIDDAVVASWTLIDDAVVVSWSNASDD